MSGPLSGLLHFVGKEVGNALGNKLARDIRAAERVFTKSWTHAEKIEELKTDSGLSPSYIKELVQESSGKEELTSIKEYLLDQSKAANVTSQARSAMLKKINAELDRIQDSEILRQLIEAAKSKGVSCLELISDLA
jgi:AraC-like DNA-binding protein